MDTLHLLEQLIAIDSPTGFTSSAADFIEETLRSYGFSPIRTVKGAVRCGLGPAPTLALAAHTDTLGAIVSGFNTNGTLRFSLLGGPLLPSFEGGYVRLHTLDGKVVTGTLLLNDPSTHANNKAASLERTPDGMHIRLDESVKTADEVRALGIRIGDIVAFDPKYQALPNGFVKSHFLDNKAGCYVLFEVARQVASGGVPVPVELFFSTYEEVGHGGAPSYSETVNELLVIDMGVVGEKLEGSEQKCSICAKDSGGPYDYGFRKRLVQLAENQSIPFALDVYPFYSSDGTAAWRAGVDARVALIGPGVHASHGMERTHVDGMKATVDLCMAYINDTFKG
ncbi:MAG: M42 family metallopeptidase [Ignavibacteria bacterium]|nr:M42 family metallopeptidase [Ignavibacteria bacterium]MBK7184398.1 M42 family metallopeptidase [Ignavibacteria bacterium]MBK7413202.1 M42 family metallopeptidase [Ignavibacteria bacterium]MBP6509138.1 M42 family metallopeptidase [Candidatus Kapabacteria bacterium]MBP7094001.1 M42 family metallopeptidase [Candidatus Kapabacteria bacterium]